MRYLILLIISIFFTQISLNAQSAGASAGGNRNKLPVINFLNGQIDLNLPYGQSFFLKGSSTSPKGEEADVVIMMIFQANRRCKKNCGEGCSFQSKPVFYQTWRKSEEKKDLEFLVNKKLSYGQCYKLEFRYYKEQPINKERIKEIFESVYNSFAVTGRSFSNSTDVIVELLEQQLKGNLQSLSQEKLKDEFRRKFNQGPGIIPATINNLSGTDLFVQQEIPSWITQVDDPGDLAFQVGNIVNFNYAKGEYEKDIREIFTELRNAYNPKLYDELRKITLRESTQIKQKEIDFTLTRVEQLRNFQSEALFTKGLFESLQPLVLDDVIISDPAIKNEFEIVMNKLEEITILKEEIDIVQENIDAAEARIDEIIQPIEDQYILVDIASAASVTGFSSVEELEGTKFDTPVGIGATLFNPMDNNSEFNGLGYLGLRYYFGPVDKRLTDNPYLGSTWPFKRMSIVAGVLLGGDYVYRGQELSNVFGVKPLFGIGYDISRFFTIDFGIITFRQETINPLDPTKNWRVAPQISFSLEADLFNRINTWSKEGEQYKKFSTAFGVQ